MDDFEWRLDAWSAFQLSSSRPHLWREKIRNWRVTSRPARKVLHSQEFKTRHYNSNYGHMMGSGTFGWIHSCNINIHHWRRLVTGPWQNDKTDRPNDKTKGPPASRHRKWTGKILGLHPPLNAPPREIPKMPLHVGRHPDKPTEGTCGRVSNSLQAGGPQSTSESTNRSP